MLVQPWLLRAGPSTLMASQDQAGNGWSLDASNEKLSFRYKDQTVSVEVVMKLAPYAVGLGSSVTHTPCASARSPSSAARRSGSARPPAGAEAVPAGPPEPPTCPAGGEPRAKIASFLRGGVQQLDESLGMYYLRARYYHPDVDRFWTMDTYEGSQTDPLSLHKFLYVHADPANNPGNWPASRAIFTSGRRRRT